MFSNLFKIFQAKQMLRFFRDKEIEVFVFMCKFECQHGLPDSATSGNDG